MPPNSVRDEALPARATFLGSVLLLVLIGACHTREPLHRAPPPGARPYAVSLEAPASTKAAPTMLTRDDARLDDAQASDDAPPKPISDEALPAAPSGPRLATYAKILHVGDSTVGYTEGLQLEMRKKLEPLGIHYESHTLTSAGIRSLAKARVVAKFVEQVEPDLVIVQVGTNNLTAPTPTAFLPAIADIIAQVGDRPCYWIGPIALEQKEHGMRALLRQNVAPCTFFDSFDMKLERQSDHVHPTQRAARKWADAFFAFADAEPPGRLLSAPAR